MPKTNVCGGKKKKKGKNGIFENKLNSKLILADEEQYYAIVQKILGNGRFLLNCFLLDKNNVIFLKEMIGNVCGKLRRKVWIHTEDLVIISLREFSKSDREKCDIIHKYTDHEARRIKKLGLIPLANGGKNNEEVNFEIDDENENENKKKKEKDNEKQKDPNEPYLVIDMPTYSSEEEEEEIDDI